MLVGGFASLATTQQRPQKPQGISWKRGRPDLERVALCTGGRCSAQQPRNHLHPPLLLPRGQGLAWVLVCVASSSGVQTALGTQTGPAGGVSGFQDTSQSDVPIPRSVSRAIGDLIVQCVCYPPWLPGRASVTEAQGSTRVCGRHLTTTHPSSCSPQEANLRSEQARGPSWIPGLGGTVGHPSYSCPADCLLEDTMDQSTPSFPTLTSSPCGWVPVG